MCKKNSIFEFFYVKFPGCFRKHFVVVKRFGDKDLPKSRYQWLNPLPKGGLVLFRGWEVLGGRAGFHVHFRKRSVELFSFNEHVY